MLTKRAPIFLGILLTMSLSLVMTTPLYATPDHEDNCLSCHTTGGIIVTSNVTGTLEVNASTSFRIEINAEGDAGDLTIKWPSTINSLFAFVPSKVTDNGPNDDDPAGNKVKSNFKITAPAIQGRYTIQVFAAGRGGKGGTQTFEVTVTTEEPSTENLLPTSYFLHTRRGMKIEFRDRSWDPDGNITIWHWKFGDNTNSTDQNPTHTFAEPGTYTVILTVTDDQGGSNTRSQTFTVPSKAELLQLWILQVFIGSLFIVCTTVFAAGIADAHFKGGKEQ